MILEGRGQQSYIALEAHRRDGTAGRFTQGSNIDSQGQDRRDRDTVTQIPNRRRRIFDMTYVEDGLRQNIREHFLLDLEVRPWCGDIKHDKPGYFLFHGMLRIQIRCLALR